MPPIKAKVTKIERTNILKPERSGHNPKNTCESSDISKKKFLCQGQKVMYVRKDNITRNFTVQNLFQTELRNDRQHNNNMPIIFDLWGINISLELFIIYITLI